MAEQRCRHDHGWVSVKSQTLAVLDEARVMVGFGHRPRNKVLMRCNRTECPAVRLAFFSEEDGAFVRFGRVRHDKDQSRG